jgi:hypothetical protein
MADPQDQPERGAAGIPPAPRKAPAKKTPAKKAPAKKAVNKVPAAPAKKAPAKKAPAKKATPRPALAASPAATPLTDGDSAARQAAADAKASVQKADHPAALRSSPESDYRLPISLGLAAAGLVALVLSRLRRG